MAHQLRRIIAVNIKMPTQGLTTGRISEMDPRGGVLAIGTNGVGKTTFLRLLPLFYGAKPSSILRGSGVTSMIKYTLLDASSAVAYEYERDGEGPEHVRCVVMHCKAGSDAPQFVIIKGAYEERFFVDEKDEFVPRDEFKDRVQAMGLKVTPILDLHGYRAVILNERLATKEGADYRRLAAEFSLGPKPLYNLDQLASAMASEKLSFRDLQNIVLDHITEPTAQDDKPPEHVLKLNKASVSAWIDDREHLAKVLNRHQDAEDIKISIDKVRGLNLELCALHVSVKEAYAQIEPEQQSLVERESASADRFLGASNDLVVRLEQANSVKALKQEAFDSKNNQLDAGRRQEVYFERIKVRELESEESQEHTLVAQKQTSSTELALLVSNNGDIETRASAAERLIREQLASQLTAIADKEVLAERENTSEMESLRTAEDLAVGSLVPPDRLSTLDSEQLAATQLQGKLRGKLENPSPSIESQEARDAADLEVNKLQDNLNTAREKVTELGSLERRDRARADEAADRVGQVRHRLAEKREEVAAADARLSPPPGSLLEFLRGTDPEAWLASSRVLDPAALLRTDLDPHLYQTGDDAGAGDMGGMTAFVGPLALQVGGIEQPAWVDMRDLRDARARLVAEVESLEAELATATSEATSAASELSRTQQELAKAGATSSLLNSALAAAKLALATCITRLGDERAASVAHSQKELQEVEARLEALQTEKNGIKAELVQAGEKIREDFKSQRTAALEKATARAAGFGAERAAANRWAETKLAEVAKAMAEELAGKGIDPQRITNLREEVGILTERLQLISNKRHEVASWKVFAKDVLPSLSSWADEVKRLEVELGQATALCAEIVEQQTKLREAIRLENELIADARESLRRRERQLQEILVQLKDFYPRAKPDFAPAWDTAQLEQEVGDRKHSLSVELQSLQDKNRVLRNAMMSRSGPLQHWLEHKEASLPDANAVLPHEYAVHQAEVLSSWFRQEEHGAYVDQLYKEMLAFLQQAAQFVRMLNVFDRRVAEFNRELQQALTETAHFERFGKLSVTVSSGIGQLDYMSILNRMAELSEGQNSRFFTYTVKQELPTAEHALLISRFRDILQSDTGVRVNLSDQVRLSCSVVENGTHRTITNEQEFKAVSSNGNTALINAMFLMGFVHMVRGKGSPVRLTWVTDELARFDAANVDAFLKTMDSHNINVIGAAPSLDPSLSRFFPRICIFEPSGEVATSNCEIDEENIHVFA